MPLPSTPEPPPPILHPMIEVLMRYVSAPTAHGIVNLARARIGARDAVLERSHLREMVEPIGRNLLLFVPDQARREDCLATLRALVGGEAPESTRASVVLEIRVEDDIARARIAARDLAAREGFSTVGQTRLVTAVSELARNIFQYARVGRIELKRTVSPPGLSITAVDRGPGIANLEEIMSGNYKSKHGMGLGLRGVKRLAQRFDIQTGPGRGTTVSLLMKVT